MKRAERGVAELMNKKHGGLSGWVMPILVLLLVGYLLIDLLHNQAAISAKQQELAQVQAQLAEQNAVNQELTRSLADGEDAIIERIAREQGYAQPNERIFVGY